MPALPHRKPPIRPLDHSPDRNRNVFTPSEEGHRELASDLPEQCVCCELREGLPVVRQRVPSYYVSKPGGGLMLTLERKKGERLRVCGAVDVIVLEINSGEVKLGVSRPPDVVVGRRRPYE